MNIEQLRKFHAALGEQMKEHAPPELSTFQPALQKVLSARDPLEVPDNLRALRTAWDLYKSTYANLEDLYDEIDDIIIAAGKKNKAKVAYDTTEATKYRALLPTCARQYQEALNTTKIVDDNKLDTLRDSLDSLVKFAGYDSISEAATKAGFSNENLVQFNPASFSKLEKKPAQAQGLTKSDVTFFTKLYNDFDKKSIDKEGVISRVLLRFGWEFPVVSFSDKLRYLSLLKMAEDLGADPKKIKGILNSVLSKSFDTEKNLTQEERKTIKACYMDFYNNGTKTREALNTKMHDFVEDKLAEELKSGRDIDTPRHAYLINMALDFAAYSSIKKFNSQETVEILSRREDGKEALFQAAKDNENIYREMVEPKNTWSYFLRGIREALPKWFGIGIGPRPTFDSIHHSQLIANHLKLLNNADKNNPYKKIVNGLSPEEKVNFLMNCANNNKEIGEIMRDEGFFNPTLKDHLKSRGFTNLEDLIRKANPSLLDAEKEISEENSRLAAATGIENPPVAPVPQDLSQAALAHNQATLDVKQPAVITPATLEENTESNIERLKIHASKAGDEIEQAEQKEKNLQQEKPPPPSNSP